MSKTEIIAEIGVNANGNIDVAKKLVDAAIDAGADTVKFQATFPRIEMSPLLMPERIKMTEEVILNHIQIGELIEWCERQKIPWLCTPSESESLAWLMRWTYPKRIKVGSDNLTNLPFLREVAACRLPVLLSTGMATLEETYKAYDVLHAYLAASAITIMHCTSSYPCAIEDANLRALREIRSSTRRMKLGWSDHTTSPFLACAAVALGAVVIEKHITLDRKAKGPDHAASIDPLQFATMVRLIRETELALGDGIKAPRKCEMDNRQQTRKSIIAKKNIRLGTILSEENIIIQRPGVGRTPSEWEKILGTYATREYQEGELI